MPGRRSVGGSGRGSRRGSGSRKSQKGKEKTPKLVRWTNDLDIELLLAVQCWCQKAGMKIPWDTICKEYFGEPFTEGAITQHLSKLRVRRIDAGLRVPPPLRRSPKEAEKQAASLKRKNANANDFESDEDVENGGLFIEDNEDDEEYLPTLKRTKKDTKSKKRSSQETARSARTTRPEIRLNPMDEPAANLDVEFPTYHPSSDPSPFDYRYRDARSSTVQPMAGPAARDASTDESSANAIQSQGVPTSAPPAFTGRFVPWTAVATFPTIPAGHGQNFHLFPQGHTFNTAKQANNYAPAFRPHPMAPPASAISDGRPMTGSGSGSDMTTGQNFGPGCGSKQQYWRDCLRSLVQPAGNQALEVINLQELQSRAEPEVKRECDAADPQEEQEFDFEEFLNDE